MARSAIVSIKLVGDAESARRALSETATAAEKFQRGINVAAGYATVGLAAISAASMDWISSASEAEQASGALEAVFKDQASAMQANAEAAADAVGLASSEYSQMAAVIASQLKNLGVEQADLGAETDNLIRLGADLSAQFGGSTADAVAALSSLLRGERDPIERYGVSIKQAGIDAKVAELGLSGLSDEAKTAAERQAVLALLAEQTADAQGAFAREADTAAGAQQRANAEYENAKAALGAAFLPIVAEAARWMQGFATWAKENPALIQAIVIGLGALSLAILAIAGVTAIMNATWLASPITWIVLGIVAAVTVVIITITKLAQHWDEIMAWIGQVGENVGRWFSDVWNGIASWWSDLWNGIGDWWASLWDGLFSWWSDLWNGIVGWLNDLWNGFASWWADLWNGLFGWVSDLGQFASDTLGWIGSLSATTDATMTVTHAAAAASYDPMLPMVFTLASLPPIMQAFAPLATAASSTVSRTAHYTINVSGATDREATAREIRDMIRDLERSEGRL